MSEYAVSGQDLRAALKLARKGPISFAFNPGKTTDEHMLGLHKTKSADILALSIKKSGAGIKVCSGTCTIDGTLMQLTTDAPLSGMAKKLKAFLKFNKVSLNVIILGPDGAVLEQEVEQLPDDPDAESPTAEGGAATGSEAAPDLPEGATDRTAELMQRLSTLQPKVKAAPETMRPKLVAAFTQVAAQIKGKEFDAAVTGLDALEKILAQVPDPSSGPVEDPRLAQLRLDHAATMQRVEMIGDAAVKAKLAGALGIIGKMIAAGQIDPATEGLKKIQSTFPGPEAEKTASVQPDLAALRNRLRELVAQINAVPDEARRRALAGLANAANIALKAADAGAASLALDQLSDGLVTKGQPHQPLLPIWRDARDLTNAQLTQLQDAMRKHGMPLFQRIADKGLNGITDKHLVSLQVKLMNVDSVEGEARQQAVEQLRGAIGEMRDFLATNPVLPLLERNTLKVAIDLRGTLGAALDQIDQALAA